MPNQPEDTPQKTLEEKELRLKHLLTAANEKATKIMNMSGGMVNPESGKLDMFFHYLVNTGILTHEQLVDFETMFLEQMLKNMNAAIQDIQAQKKAPQLAVPMQPGAGGLVRPDGSRLV